MVTHMKTTVEIPETLFKQAKEIAAREHTTLRALVEDGLRRVIELRRNQARPFKLRKASFFGEGLQPDVAEGSWERIRELIYEERGG